jgi:hypothetical protein
VRGLHRPRTAAAENREVVLRSPVGDPSDGLVVRAAAILSVAAQNTDGSRVRDARRERKTDRGVVQGASVADAPGTGGRLALRKRREVGAKVERALERAWIGGIPGVIERGCQIQPVGRRKHKARVGDGTLRVLLSGHES